jgi:hypothetical protein
MINDDMTSRDVTALADGKTIRTDVTGGEMEQGFGSVIE